MITISPSPINNDEKDYLAESIEMGIKTGAKGWFSKKPEEKTTLEYFSPISQSSIALQAKAKRFPRRIEVLGYGISTIGEYINKFVLPENIIGVDCEREEKRELEDLNDIYGETTAFLAQRRDTGEKGIHFVSSREGVAQDKNQFFEISQLILDREIVEYVPKDILQKAFPGVDIDKISKKDLTKVFDDADYRSNNEFRSKRAHTYLRNGTPRFDIDYLLGQLNVDMVTSKGSAHPMDKLLLRVLAMNKLTGKISMDHTHYKYTPQEVQKMSSSSRIRYEIFYKYDSNFEELLSDYDLGLIATYTSMTDKLSVGKYPTRLAFMGVTLLSSTTLDILGKTSFDAIAIGKNRKDSEELKYLYKAMEETEDEGEIRDFVQLVRAYSLGADELHPLARDLD